MVTGFSCKDNPHMTHHSLLITPYSFDTETPMFIILAYILMILGLIGSLLPVLPGPIFIWLGVFVWAYADGFQAIGWPTLAFLGILTVIAWVSDLALTTILSRRAGISWKSIGAAILGGIAGGILLSGVLILGSIVGTILGAIGGLVLFEYREKQDWDLAWKSAKTYLVGFFGAVVIETGLSLIMLGIFAWQAFL